MLIFVIFAAIFCICCLSSSVAGLFSSGLFSSKHADTHPLSFTSRINDTSSLDDPVYKWKRTRCNSDLQ